MPRRVYFYDKKTKKRSSTKLLLKHHIPLYKSQWSILLHTNVECGACHVYPLAPLVRHGSLQP